jgi:SAM-dependent methyltransferase
LEIGCEYGFFLPSLCQISDKVIGSDIKTNFDYCEKITLNDIKKNNANLELKTADATCLSDSIPEKSCDAIVAISVLEHINDFDKAIGEISKCLKPNGIFVCVLPSENWFYKLIKNILRHVATDFRKHYYPHRKEYDPKKIEASLCTHFNESERHNSPFGLPLFVTRVYVKKEMKYESSDVN